jgi:hypothetical protein
MTRTETSALDRKLAFWSATNEQHQIDKHNAAMVQELIAALEQALKVVDAHRRATGGDGDITAALMRSAIAKARGE